jgi:cytochrome c-type biogenesis protein
VSVAGLVTDGPLLVAAPVAAAAGLLSFLSPCVLPLVPGYLSFVTGLSGEDLEAAGRRVPEVPQVVDASSGGVAVAVRPPAVTARSVVARLAHTSRVAGGTGLFVLGFTVVFVSYGAAFGGLGSWLVLHQVGLSQALGVVTIVMGLAFAGAFSKLSVANREWRVHRLPPPGLVGASALGALFGLGWTPCLGPTLVAVSGLALQSATAGRGAFLSAAYCLGLGIPFLAAGLAFRRAVGALAAVRRHARVVTAVGGGLLVVLGVLQVSGLWVDLVAELRLIVPGFSETPL